MKTVADGPQRRGMIREWVTGWVSRAEREGRQGDREVSVSVSVSVSGGVSVSVSVSVSGSRDVSVRVGAVESAT